MKLRCNVGFDIGGVFGKKAFLPGQALQTLPGFVLGKRTVTYEQSITGEGLGPTKGPGQGSTSMGEVARPWTKGLNLGERRRSGGHTPSGVCRNLFGTYDREENTRFVKEELALIAERERERWNFDFKEEKPKEGRYEWTLLSKDDGDLAPDRGRRFDGDRPGTSVESSDEVTKDAKTNSPLSEKKRDAASSKDGKDEELTQTQITDFLRKRKSTVSKKLTGGGDSPSTLHQDTQVKVKRRAST